MPGFEVPLPDETPQQKADRQLMARVAQGDQAAFGALYDRLSGPLYSLGCKMLDDTAEAEDVLQEISLQIWRRAASYDPAQSSVFSWAVLLARSRIIDRLRARGRRLRVIAATGAEESSVQTSEASAVETTAEIIQRNEEAMRVRSMLINLPADQRQAVEMAFFSGLTHHEIAAQLEQPLGTVKARIRRGLLRLRDELRKAP